MLCVRGQDLNRREFLRAGAISTGVLWGLGRVLAAPFQSRFAAGRFLGLVAFIDEGASPTDTRIGAELDARLYTDLTRISERQVVTPTAEFYLRTGVSRLFPNPDNWAISVEGLVEHPTRLGISKLRSSAKRVGPHLMECAGNTRFAQFGLMSVANWTGVPISEILNEAGVKARTSRVLVSGFDRYATQSATSIAGASWIFRQEELRVARAFLATEMNGRPLTPDHGAPVRLVVPAWYGCACIKWVNRISLVDDSVDATSQMQEYASRTLQDGIPQLAKEYRPAVVDHAAIPTRVEKWSLGGKIKYRVVGVLWGGSKLVKVLQIRFNPDEDFVSVNGFRQTETDPWTIWTHMWSPQAPGAYSIRLAVADPPVRTRKLDAGYYVRTVEIAEV